MNIIMKSGRTFTRDIEYYLAGPMTGLPELNYPAFEKAVAQLQEHGIKVRSPHAIDYEETPETRGQLPYSTYLKGGYRLLLECGGIIMLNGWTRSRGTKHELYIARSLGYPVFTLGEGFMMELESDEH